MSKGPSSSRITDNAGGAEPSAVVMKDACVRFGDQLALEDISLTVDEGAFITILGPSGCGKSTLLRLVSDLVPIDDGEITIFGNEVETARLKREFSFVFQDATLLPWRSAIDNVRLPLEIGVKLEMEVKLPWQLQSNLRRRPLSRE